MIPTRFLAAIYWLLEKHSQHPTTPRWACEDCQRVALTIAEHDHANTVPFQIWTREGWKTPELERG
mgnify:CR=1 FL=1